MKPILHKLICTIITAMSFALRGYAADAPPAIFHNGDCVLFQGDSITDGGRQRTGSDLNHTMGQDYAYLIAARMGADFPESHLLFLNRGNSGNKVSDLAARWQDDALALKPGVLSILIGVNDVGHDLNESGEVSFGQIEQTYDKLLTDTERALPGVKIVLCEPFILPGRGTSARWNDWQAAMARMRDIVRKLAAEHKLPVVHFQKVFDDALKRAPADYWIWDGVHPTYAGHQLMADEWMRVVKSPWPK